MRLRLNLNILERSLVGNDGVEFDATVGDEDNLERGGPNETEDFRNFPFDGLGVFHRIDLAIGIIGKFHRLLTCVRNQYNRRKDGSGASNGQGYPLSCCTHFGNLKCVQQDKRYC